MPCEHCQKKYGVSKRKLVVAILFCMIIYKNFGEELKTNYEPFVANYYNPFVTKLYEHNYSSNYYEPFVANYYNPFVTKLYEHNYSSNYYEPFVANYYNPFDEHNYSSNYYEPFLSTCDKLYQYNYVNIFYDCNNYWTLSLDYMGITKKQ